MPSTTPATHPLSYYEVLSTFWAATCAARGTDLRGQSLVNLDVLGPVPHGLVAELGSKLRPAGIEHGLGQAGSGQSTRIELAYTDAPILPHQSCGQAVQEVLTIVRDLGVDRLHTGLAAGALRNNERTLVLSIQARSVDLLARGERRKALKAQIDTDLPGPSFLISRDLDLQIEIPAAAGISSEAATKKPAFDRSAQPKPVPSPEKDRGITLYANRARGLEGNPSQGLPTTPSWPFATGIARDCKLLADRLYRIRVQPQKLTAAEGKPDQVEARGPAFVMAVSGLLDLPAVVPDAVHGRSLSLKMPAGGRILDPISVRQHHANMVVYRCCKSKTDAQHAAGIFTPDSPSAAAEIAALYGRTPFASGLRDDPHRQGFRRGEFV